jgi:hypothetical protein
MRYLAFLAVLAALVIGCGPQGPTKPKDDAAKKDKDDHDHDHGEGPHGGTLADLADEKENVRYHGEFAVDHGKKQATVFILRGDARTAAPIKADKVLVKIKEPTFEVELKPMPQSKDPEGASSRFVGTHEMLGKVQEFAGTIIVTVEGKEYKGDFKEEPPKKK